MNTWPKLLISEMTPIQSQFSFLQKKMESITIFLHPIIESPTLIISWAVRFLLFYLWCIFTNLVLRWWELHNIEHCMNRQWGGTHVLETLSSRHCSLLRIQQEKCQKGKERWLSLHRWTVAGVEMQLNFSPFSRRPGAKLQAAVFIHRTHLVSCF